MAAVAHAALDDPTVSLAESYGATTQARLSEPRFEVGDKAGSLDDPKGANAGISSAAGAAMFPKPPMEEAASPTADVANRLDSDDSETSNADTYRADAALLSGATTDEALRAAAAVRRGLDDPVAPQVELCGVTLIASDEDVDAPHAPSANVYGATPAAARDFDEPGDPFREACGSAAAVPVTVADFKRYPERMVYVSDYGLKSFHIDGGWPVYEDIAFPEYLVGHMSKDDFSDFVEECHAAMHAARLSRRRLLILMFASLFGVVASIGLAVGLLHGLSGCWFGATDDTGTESVSEKSASGKNSPKCSRYNTKGCTCNQVGTQAAFEVVIGLVPGTLMSCCLLWPAKSRDERENTESTQRLKAVPEKYNSQFPSMSLSYHDRSDRDKFVFFNILLQRAQE